MGTVSLAVPLVPTELPSFLSLLLYHPTTEEEEGNVLLCRRNSSSVMSVKIAFILKLQDPIGELSFLPTLLLFFSWWRRRRRKLQRTTEETFSI